MEQIKLFDVVNLPEMEAAAVEVLRSGKIASGSYVERFEEGLSRITGQEHMVSTVDLTSAISLALRLSGVGPGDEVITTAFACMATNSAIALAGATPVWVDLLPASAEYSIDDLRAKISARTKAVIVYHIAGYPSPAREIAAICREHGIFLIEDCDNALLASRDGQPVGNEGDFAVYSFYPNRQINTCEGGALGCRSPEIAARARKLRRFGIDAKNFRNALGEIDPAADIPEIWGAITMNNLSAALGCAQFASVSERIEKTRQNVALLQDGIRGALGIRPVVTSGNSLPAYWVWLLTVENRDRVLALMKAGGIHVSSLHQRNDVYTGFVQCGPASIPNTEDFQRKVIAIPCGWWLSKNDIKSILESLLSAVKSASRS